MALIVCPNAIVDPRAMTDVVNAGLWSLTFHLLIVFCHTAAASPTMFASDRGPDHTIRTEVVLIEFPQTEQFVNDRFLRGPTAELRDETRILDHAHGVEIPAQRIANQE